MDSVTRFAMAQREIGLAVGEPPATRGYTPSVFAQLPRLLERAGSGETGTITALYTVLVEGDDFNEPVADTVRGILDGHIVLSRTLAQANHYPAIDVLESVSRLVRDVCRPEQVTLAGKAREHLAVYRRNEDLITIGAHQKGANPALDRAVALHEPLRGFLCQSIEERCERADTFARLQQLLGTTGGENR
jgi:flagellum-specific ATP synthase